MINSFHLDMLDYQMHRGTVARDPLRRGLADNMERHSASKLLRLGRQWTLQITTKEQMQK